LRTIAKVSNTVNINSIRFDSFSEREVAASQREARRFYTAERTLEGVEAPHMMGKGQVKRLDGRDSVGQAKFIASLFG
jgi:hypothetical protein